MEKGCESGTSPAAYPTWDIHLLTRYPKQPTVHIFILSNQPIKRGFNEISVRDVKLSYGMRYVITCLIPYGFCTTLFGAYTCLRNLIETSIFGDPWLQPWGT